MATPVQPAQSGGQNRETPDRKAAGNRISGTVEERVSDALRSLKLESGVGKVSKINERRNASTSKNRGDESDSESSVTSSASSATLEQGEEGDTTSDDESDESTKRSTVKSLAGKKAGTSSDEEGSESDKDLSDADLKKQLEDVNKLLKEAVAEKEQAEAERVAQLEMLKKLLADSTASQHDGDTMDWQKQLEDLKSKAQMVNLLKEQLEDVNKLLKEAVAEKEQAEAERVAQLEMLKKLLADSTASQHDGDTMDWQKQLEDLKSKVQMVNLLNKQLNKQLKVVNKLLKEEVAEKKQLQDAKAKHINGNTRYHLVGTTGHIAPKDVDAQSWERFWRKVMCEDHHAARIPDCKCPCEYCPYPEDMRLYSRDTKPKVVGAHCIVKSNDGAWYIGIVPTCDNCNHVRNTRPITKDCTAVTIFRLSTDPLVGDLGLARPLVKATVAMESLQEQTSRLKCKAGEEEIELCKLLETKTITLSPVKPFAITCIAPIRQEEDESQASSSAAPRTRIKLILKKGYKASTSRNNGA